MSPARLQAQFTHYQLWSIKTWTLSKTNSAEVNWEITEWGETGVSNKLPKADLFLTISVVESASVDFQHLFQLSDFLHLLADCLTQVLQQQKYIVGGTN